MEDKCCFTKEIYKQYLKKRFGVSVIESSEDISILRNKQIVTDIAAYRDYSSPVPADRDYSLTCYTCSYLPVVIDQPINQDPNFANIYYGILNAYIDFDKAIIEEGIPQSVGITDPFININYGAIKPLNPMYYWLAAPVSIVPKTKWFVDMLNNGNIQSASDLYSIPATVDGYNLYLTNYKTVFDSFVQFQN